MKVLTALGQVSTTQEAEAGLTGSSVAAAISQVGAGWGARVAAASILLLLFPLLLLLLSSRVN